MNQKKSSSSHDSIVLPPSDMPLLLAGLVVPILATSCLLSVAALPIGILGTTIRGPVPFAPPGWPAALPLLLACYLSLAASCLFF